MATTSIRSRAVIKPNIRLMATPASSRGQSPLRSTAGPISRTLAIQATDQRSFIKGATRSTCPNFRSMTSSSWINKHEGTKWFPKNSSECIHEIRQKRGIRTNFLEKIHVDAFTFSLNLHCNNHLISHECLVGLQPTEY